MLEISSTGASLESRTEEPTATPEELIEAIERDSESLARLLQTCGSSRNFDPSVRQEFERLLRHRQELAARLENLRS